MAVREVMASSLTNKYAEGYPGKRYYGGCEVVDEAETLAIDRLKELFGAEHANVQPHSGAQANMAVYLALLKPGDTVLGMRLDHGGHLTHGNPVNSSGLLYNFIAYGVRDSDETIDYDQAEKLAKENRPKIIVVGASAYSRFIDFARFRAIADEVGALFMTDIAHPAGLIATGIHPSPVGHAHIVTSTTHKTLRGPRGGVIMPVKDLAEKIDKAVFPGAQGGPLMHTIAAKAVAFHEALQPEFRTYTEKVVANAKALAKALQEKGFRIVSGGTDNHLMIVDLTNSGVNGRQAEIALDKVHITASRSTIPNDPQPPFRTSGIRLGTPAITTRGFGEKEMPLIADWISRTLQSPTDPTVLESVKVEVLEVCRQFPVPGEEARTPSAVGH